MTDHDQRFKALLREFFAEFFQLFFPQWAERFDFARVEWLDKEFFADPPQGERLVMDLIAQLPTRQEVPAQRPGEADSWIALVHIEVEQRTSAAGLRPRMFDYYQQLRRRHRKPVLPIGLYLQVGLDGVGVDVYEEQFWDFRPLWFQYLYVGLPALDAQTYLKGDNWLGVALAALMKIPEGQKALFKAEAWRRLVQCPENTFRKFLLVECVDAYLPLELPQQQTFDALLTSTPFKGTRTMALSMFDQMLKKDRLEAILSMLETRFGPLSAKVLERLNAYTPEQLFPLFRGILTASSLKDLGLED